MEIGLVRMGSGEDPLVLKNPEFIYTAGEESDLQLSNEERNIIAKWMSRISCSHLIGYLLSVLAWIMCIVSTASVQWRIWKVKLSTNMSNGVVWIGIWKVCFFWGANSHNAFYQCEEFTENYKSLPKEIFLAQDLMTLCCTLGAVASSFMSFALWNVYKPITYKDFLLVFFNLAAILNLVAGLLIFIPVSLNLHSILIKSKIVFPNFFKLPELPEDQYPGAAIYIGYISSGLCLLSGTIILSQKCVWKVSELCLPSITNKFSSERSTVSISPRKESCLRCGYSGPFYPENSALPESSTDELIVTGSNAIRSSPKPSPKQSPGHIQAHPVIVVTPCK